MIKTTSGIDCSVPYADFEYQNVFTEYSARLCANTAEFYYCNMLEFELELDFHAWQRPEFEDAVKEALIDWAELEASPVSALKRRLAAR
jgi:hypothetical protein